MTIRGLTDRQAAFPVIGILRKGAPKAQGQNRPGQDLTYFRYAPLDGEEESAKVFYDVYGGQPRTIKVRLPFQTTDECFEAYREAWTASALQHRCDGETCLLWRDPKTGELSHEPKPCPGGCKQVGRLRVIVPDMQRLAIVTVLTTSIYDIMALSENLKAIEALRSDLRGLPLVLKRRSRRVSVPEIDKNGKRTGARKRMEKFLLSIEVDPDVVGLMILAMQAAALPEAGETLRLARPRQAAIPARAQSLPTRQVETETEEVGDLNINPGGEDEDDDADYPGDGAPAPEHGAPVPDETPDLPAGAAPAQPSLISGAVATATVDEKASKKWGAVVTSLANAHKGVFMSAEGLYKVEDMLAQASAAGYATITNENAGEVFRVLNAYALKVEAGK